MSEWTEIGHILANGGIPTSAITFDSHSELLWTGSSYGIVASHVGPQLQRYTSWPAHLPSNSKSVGGSRAGGVKGFACDDRAIYSVGDNGIKATTRRGLSRWNLNANQTEMPTLCPSAICFSPTASSDIIAAGASQNAQSTGQVGKDDVIFTLNAGTGTITRKSPSEAQINHLRKSFRYICAGSVEGHVQLRDPRTLSIEHRLHAHPGGLLDMQADGNLLFSVGWTVRLGHPVLEPIVKVQDLRMLRALASVPFSAPGGPALLTTHPKRSSTIIVASPSGQFQIVDINNLSDVSYHQIHLNSYLTSMAISPSSDFLAFGEADGSVRLWASSNEATQFSSFASQQIEMPDPPELPDAINWTTETSLSKVGMPYYDEQLFSALSYNDYVSNASPLFNPPKPIDPSVLHAIRTVDKVSYAPLPRHLRGKRNVIQGTGPDGISAGQAVRRERKRIGNAPMFRSEKEAAAKRQANGSAEMANDEQDDNNNDIIARPGAMPSYYRIKTIEYSKFGVEDFDFDFYNKTNYSGLETHIENSYANAYLQALHYLIPFRSMAEAHAMASSKSNSSGCQEDNCLFCQAGFLSMMLEDAKGANCQATNFLRTLSGNERAIALGLLEKDDNVDIAYSSLIQTLNRFLLETTMAEARQAVERNSLDAEMTTKLFACTSSTRHTCTTCGNVNIRATSSNVIDLIYPRKVLSNELQPAIDFSSILKASILRETTTKTTCRACNTPNTTILNRRALSNDFPQALSINCAVNSSDHLRYWIQNANIQSQSYLPPKVALTAKGEDVSVKSLWNDDKTPMGAAIYELRSFVVQVQADKDPPHLVALIKISQEWYLFNDFLVRQISQEEALKVTASWKIPAILIWERIDKDVINVEKLSRKADERILCKDISISNHRDLSLKRHTPLLDEEVPLQPGTIIAIDSEFVALNQEELELSSTGTRKVIRPSRFSLARVSCIRGQGEREGEAFIDDFIWTREAIVDYLTQFSGILPGDLDPKTSKHTLVPLRLAYKKLRILVDAGCVFLGHGLKKDFRIINIYVPPEQVIDTVDLFQSASHPRKLSLRFLTWFLLKEEIQGPQVLQGRGIEGHDSIEDALAALRIYKLYLEFKRDDRLEDVLEDLYEAGRIHGWKPPSSSE